MRGTVTSAGRPILKAMLGALALTALAGATAVVVSNEFTWRIFWTGLTGAFTCLLILGASRRVDEPRTRFAALAAMVGATAEFILFLILIWEMHRLLPGDESEILGTAGMVAVAALGSVVFLRMLGSPVSRIAAQTGLAVTAAACATGLLATWWPRGWSGYPFGDIVEDLWVTALAIGGLGLLAVPSLVGVGTDRRHWRSVGVAAAVIALVVAEAAVWGDSAHSEILLAPLIATAAWVALANCALRLELTQGQRWLRVATLVAAGATASLWVYVVWNGFDDDFAMRASSGCSIPTVCRALGLCIIARLNRRVDTAELPRELRQITLYCPRCSKKQTLPLGAAACAACGLKLETKAEQPACHQCGYVLYGPAAQRCPECGTSAAKPAEAA